MYSPSLQYKRLRDINVQTLSVQSKSRPSCQEILDSSNEWALNYEIVKFEIEQMLEPGMNYDIDKQFVLHFLQYKKQFQN